MQNSFIYGFVLKLGSEIGIPTSVRRTQFNALKLTTGLAYNHHQTERTLSIKSKGHRGMTASAQPIRNKDV